MWQTIRETLIYCDYIAWYYLNTEWHNVVLDAIVPYLRNQWTWAPLYLFLLVFMLMNFGKKGAVWCLFFIVTFSISDYVSASLLKPLFERTRPCNNPYLAQIVHNIVPCGGGYSFPSSHAANHFGLAIFMGTTIRHRVKRIWPLALIWAFSIAYAQVYVGVHFPFDVLFGGVLGACVGVITGNTFNKHFNLGIIKTAPAG
jgi:undecaprenyl-diphosphatase